MSQTVDYKMKDYNELQTFLKTNKRTWLITGVAGFIGSNLLEKLLGLNQKVVGIDNFDTGYRENIEEAIDEANLLHDKDLGDNFYFIEGDVRNFDQCVEACEGVDYVLHQAALGSVPRSIEDPIRTNKSNIGGFLNMLVACKEANIKRFVYASSSSTYGDHPDSPKIEENIGKPLSPYAVTKLVNELYADVFSKTYDFDSIGLRYFNIFGKRQDPNGAYAAVIPKWIHGILHKEDIIINGDGETSRDFCYVENTIQINLLAAMTQNKDAVNQIYNVALNDNTTLNELYKIIEDKLVKNLQSLERREPIYSDFRAGDIRHSRADINKAKTLLGYEPKYRISEGLEETIAWYLNSFYNSKEKK